MQAQKVEKKSEKVLKYVTSLHQLKEPAYFLNGYLCPQSYLQKIKSENVKNIYVVKRDTTVNRVDYYGQIFIELKKDIKTPDFIYVSQLDSVYKEIPKIPTIYSIDNEPVEDPYKKLIDKNSILDLEIHELGKIIEDFKLQIVNVITKKEENTKHKKHVTH